MASTTLQKPPNEFGPFPLLAATNDISSHSLSLHEPLTDQNESCRILVKLNIGHILDVDKSGKVVKNLKNIYIDKTGNLVLDHRRNRFA